MTSFQEMREFFENELPQLRAHIETLEKKVENLENELEAQHRAIVQLDWDVQLK
jgi:archaellum component FlaC